MKLTGETITTDDVRKIVKALATAYNTAGLIEEDMEEGEIDPYEAADAFNAMFAGLKSELDDERDGLDNPLSEIIFQMQIYGGSFVQSLAETIRVSDPENRAKILATWPEVFQRYDAIATLEAAKSKPI